MEQVQMDKAACLIMSDHQRGCFLFFQPVDSVSYFTEGVNVQARVNFIQDREVSLKTKLQLRSKCPNMLFTSQAGLTE